MARRIGFVLNTSCGVHVFDSSYKHDPPRIITTIHSKTQIPSSIHILGKENLGSRPLLYNLFMS